MSKLIVIVIEILIDHAESNIQELIIISDSSIGQINWLRLVHNIGYFWNNILYMEINKCQLIEVEEK